MAENFGWVWFYCVDWVVFVDGGFCVSFFCLCFLAFMSLGTDVSDSFMHM